MKKQIKKLCDNYNKSTEDWEDYFPREIEKLFTALIEKKDKEIKQTYDMLKAHEKEAIRELVESWRSEKEEYPKSTSF